MTSPSAPRAYVGIDGGGTRTRALAVDATGRELATASSGPSNPRNLGVDAAADAIAASIRALGLDDASAVAAGIAGLADDALVQKLAAALRDRLPALAGRPLILTHDLKIAWRGAFGGGSGICLVAGTGSACYARTAEGESARVSGRAANRDDPGSGYAIGRGAIALSLAPAPADPHDRAAIAARAPAVFAAASAGSRAAKSFLAEQAEALADMAAEAAVLFSGPARVPIALLGGVLRGDAPYREQVAGALRKRRASLAPVEPRATALAGAADMARALEDSARPQAPQ